MRTKFTPLLMSQCRFVVFLLSLFIGLGVSLIARAQNQIVRPTAANGAHVTNAGRAINGNVSQYAQLEAYAGIALGGGAYKGQLSLEFDHTVPAFTTTFVRIKEDKRLTDILLGGSLGNLLGGLADGLVFGDVSLEVEVYGTGGRFINRSSDDKFNDNEIRLVVGGDNEWYLAITPGQAYNRIRISNVIEAAVGLFSRYYLDVYDVFYYSGTQTCGGPMGTSYDVSGVNLNVLSLGGNQLAESLGLSIDGDQDTYSVLSPGVLNIAGTVHQHFYFPTSGLPTDELKITLSLSQQLLNLSVLSQIKVILYENDVVVHQGDLQSIGDGLLGIIGVDLLGLFESGEPATFAVKPGVAFDRAEIQLGSLLNTALGGDLRIHEVSRTASRPTVTEADADGNVWICSGQPVTLTAVPGVSTDVIKWYDAPVNGALLHTGSTFTPDPITYKTVYYVDATADGCTEASVRVAVALDINKDPVIQLNGSSVFTVQQGETVQLPAAAAFNADDTPALATRWTALNAAPLNGTVAGPFNNPGIYTYRFEADGPTCTNFIDVHVYVIDPSGCNFVYNRVYANDATVYTQSQLLGLPLGTVEDVNDAADPDMTKFSVLDETINPLAGLLTGRTSQTLRWHQNVPSGTPVTVKLAREFETVAVNGGIYVQALLGGQPIGTAVLVDQNLVSALGGVNEFDYTFIPSEGGVFQEYDAVRVTLNPGIVNVTQRVRIYGAYYHQLGSTLADCTGGTVDVMAGYEGVIGGLNLATSLTAVSYPMRAVDGDESTFAIMNNAVGVNIKSKLDITFKQPTLAGDSVYLKVGIPSGLLDLTLLENFSIQRYLGDQTVGEPIAFSNALLKLSLLPGSTTGVITFENDQAFDRIKILSGGIVDALAALRVYEIKSIPVAVFPDMEYDAANDVYFVKLCAGGSVTLPVDGCGDIRFFDAPTGGNEITPVDIESWTAGTVETVYVQIERFGCIAGDERREIELRVTEVDKPIIAPAGHTHVRDGGQITLSIFNRADYSAGVIFEWYRDGVLIAGETGSTLDIDPIDTNTDLGSYTAVAVENCKSAESDAVILLAYDLVGWKSYTVSTGNDFVSGGEEITYTVHLRNNSSEPVQGLSVSDDIPANTSYVANSATAGGTFANGAVTWSGIDLAAGATTTVSFKVKVEANLIGVSAISNVALILVDAGDPGTETYPPLDNDNPTDPDDTGDPGTDIPVVLTYNLDVEKTGNDASVVAGEATSFTVTITNGGPSYLDAGKDITMLERPGTGVTITDYEVVSGSASINGTGNDAVLTTTSVIAPNESIVIRVLAMVASSASGTITNGISVWNPDTPPTDPPVDDDTDPIPVDQSTDLEIVKTVDNDQPYVDDDIEFTLTVTNNGPSDANGVVVTDELPGGFTYVSSSASKGGYDPATDRWTIGDLENGETATLTIVATVLATGDYINYASVTGDEDDPDLTNNEDTPDDPVVPVDESESRLVVVKNNALADGVDENRLEVTILDTRGDGLPGQEITFTITRAGGATETEVMTTDANGKALLSLTSTVPGQVEVAATTPGQVIANSPRTVTFRVGPVDHARSELIITKDHAKADGTDENILEARIVDAAGHPISGQQVQFTITAVNNTTSTRTVTTDVNGVAELRLTSSRIGSVIVAAQVGGTAIGGSPQSVTFVMATDLSVSKSADATEVVAGESTSFTITILNNSTVTIPSGERILLGERPGAGVEITGFAVVSGQATVTFTGNNATVTTTGNLPTNGQIVIRVTADIAESATGSIGNGISIRGPETDPGDIPDDEDDIPPVPVVKRTDLSIVKTVDNAFPFVNDNIEFTLTVTNNGPSNASGVVVTDKLPGGFNYVSSSASAGTYNPATDLWTIGDLDRGEVATLVIVAEVLGAGDYINYASITGDEDDPDLTNNEDTPDDPVVPIDRSASRMEIVKNNALADGVDENRLEVTILDTRGDPVEGKEVTFTITPSGSASQTETITTDAQGKALLRLTSSVPGQVVVAASTPGETISGSPRTVRFVIGPVDHARSELVVIKDNAQANGTDENILEARIVDAAGHRISGQQVQFTITAVDNTTTTRTVTTNTNGVAELRLTSALPGSVTVAATVGGTAINNSPETVDFLLVVDLSVEKVADETEVVAGETTSFTITIRNNSTTNIPQGERILLQERPGAGVQITGFSVLSGPATLTSSGNTATVTTTGNLVAGGSIVVRVTADIASSAQGTIGNGISVRGPGTDPDDTPDDEDDIPPVPVVKVTDLAIVKTVDNYTPFIGSNVVFTLQVTNNGPSDAEGVWVLDALPSGYAFVAANASVGSYEAGTGRWEIGDMANGDVSELRITATVLESGDYINYGKVEGDNDDPDLTNNEDTPDQPVVPRPALVNLTISKVADEAKVMAGGTTTFTLTITNSGPGVLETGSPVRLEERPGAGVEIVSYHVDSGNGSINGSGNNAVFTAGTDIPMGGTVVIKVTAQITANAGATITNGVAVRGPGKDSDDDPDDEDDSGPVPVDREMNIPNLFTPNGDGINDRFVIRGLQQYGQRELIVINRWGNQVYNNRNYNNDWDGGSLPDGTYFYILKVRNSGEWTTYRGPVAIIRNPTTRR